MTSFFRNAARASVLLSLLPISTIALASNPFEVLVEDFEDGTTGGAVAVTTTNSSASANSNSTISNVLDAGSKRLRIIDTDGGVNGSVISITAAIPGPGSYLVTADVKVDNATSSIGSFGMAAKAGAPSTTKAADVSAGYVMNLTGTGDAAKGYQTIGAALKVSGGTYPQTLTLYFSTNPSGNSYSAPATDGTFTLSHRLATGGWTASGSSAVYIDNIKMFGPGNSGEERHYWISIGDNFTDPANLESMINTAFANNFNCIDIIARYRGGDGIYFIPNRTNSTYPNPEPSLVGAGNDPLQYTIDRCHELGMKTFASFSCFAVTETATYPSFLPSGSIMWVKNNSKYVAMTNGSSSADGALWADVGIAAVRAYTDNVAMDLITNYDVDGIIFDRVRYPDQNYSYNPTALSQMGYASGVKPSPTDVTFKNKRQDAVTTFLSDFYAQATTAKPWLIVGTVPIAYGYDLNETYNTVFQSWKKWESATTSNRAISFGVVDNIQPQFYRTCGSSAPASNATLMNYARYGDQAHTGFSPDYGLMPGAYTIASPLFFHPTSGDTCQSNANSQNIVDSRNQDMNGWGLYQAKETTPDIPLIRLSTANNAGVDVLASASQQPDYWFKKNYDNIAPNPAGNFAASPQPDGSCVLTWTAPTPAADGETAVKYLVYRSSSAPVTPYRGDLVTLSDVTGLTLTSPRGVAGDYYFKIVSVDDYNNWGNAVQIGPITLAGDPPPPPALIVDNLSATYVGNWSTGTGSTDKYATDYRYIKSGTGANTATFTSGPVPSTGVYAILEWHPAGTNRGTNVPHICTTNGSPVTFIVNQQIAGGSFNQIGTVNLTAGQSYTIRITDNFTNGGSKNTPWVCMADAVAWQYLHP